MSHPFGDLLAQHLHRKHGLSQGRLAAGIDQDPAVISAMSRGARLRGPGARARVVAILAWLHAHEVLVTRAEADALLAAAGLAGLQRVPPAEAALLQVLASAEPAAALRYIPQARPPPTCRWP